MLNQIFQFILFGVSMGGIYGLIALGFIFIYRSSNVVNLAQGEFSVLGGLITVSLLEKTGMHISIAIILAIVITAVTGFFIDKWAVRPIKEASLINRVLVTMGVAFILVGVFGMIFGVYPKRLAGLNGSVNVFGGIMTYQSILILAVLIIIAISVQLFLKKTKAGAMFRSISDDPYAAVLIGLNPKFIRSLAFGISAGIGAIAGVLVGPVFGLNYDMGLMMSIKGFIAAVIGGFGNPIGGMIAGMLLGILESLTNGFISSAFKDVITYSLLFIILLVRPSGIFGDAKSTNKSL
jgi:branched-chain amino acid transport system permease protein